VYRNSCKAIYIFRWYLKIVDVWQLEITQCASKSAGSNFHNKIVISLFYEKLLENLTKACSTFFKPNCNEIIRRWHKFKFFKLWMILKCIFMKCGSEIGWVFVWRKAFLYQIKCFCCAFFWAISMSFSWNK